MKIIFQGEVDGYNVPPLEIQEYQNIMENVYFDERIYRYPDLENPAHWSVPNPYGTVGMIPPSGLQIGLLMVRVPQQARKYKKVQAKKLVKSNKSIFSS